MTDPFDYLRYPRDPLPKAYAFKTDERSNPDSAIIDAGSIRNLATRTRGMNNTATFGATTQVMARSRHYMRATYTGGIAIVIPTWWFKHSTLAEVALGGTATVTAAIEDINGNFTQITWGGSATGTLPNNSNTLSDFVTPAIPITLGTPFFIRSYWQSANGALNNDLGALSGSGDGTAWGRDEANGERYRWAASGISDQTMGGSITSNAGSSGWCPAAIVGRTSKPSLYLLGDSRVEGLTDWFNDASTDKGSLPRCVGPHFPYINNGWSAMKPSDFITGHARQLELAAYCSHVICELGITELNGSNLSTVLADLQTVYGYFPGKKIFQTTIPPITTSTDLWTTTGNQSNNGPIETDRESFNNGLRNGSVAGLTGYFEFADLAESARDSGKWRVDQISAQFTGSTATTVLTVSAVAAGALAVGQEIIGGVRTNTHILSLGTGMGGTGTYNLSGNSQTVGSQAMVADPSAIDGTHECAKQNAFYRDNGAVNPALIN